MRTADIQKIKEILESSERIVVIQADNPDADSLASSLALEQILEEAGKNVWLYCGVAIPGYLKYLPGWDRVLPELPSQFEASIIVDASTMTLLEKLSQSGKQGWVASKPCIVLDHHAETDNLVPFATVLLNRPDKSSTGELIFDIAKALSWPLDKTSGEFIMTAILGDTQGLSNDLASAHTYLTMAKLIELGVDRPKLEELRRALHKMPAEIFAYKARLIERTQLLVDGKLALVTIPHQEIMQYSPLYNPNALIQGDHLQIEGVLVSVALKQYADGKITAGIRCNIDAPVGDKLAEHFGGGGHEYSSGFKLTDGRAVDEISAELTRKTAELLA